MALDVWNFEFTFQTGRFMFIEQEITDGTEVQGCNWECHNGEARSEIEDKTLQRLLQSTVLCKSLRLLA